MTKPPPRNAAATRSSARNRTRQANRTVTQAEARASHQVPQEFRELLKEEAQARKSEARNAVAGNTAERQGNEGQRPLKRRKVWTGRATSSKGKGSDGETAVSHSQSRAAAGLRNGVPAEPNETPRKQQTVIDPEESQSEDEEDWEEVGLGGSHAIVSAIAPVDEGQTSDSQDEPSTLNIVISDGDGESGSRSRVRKRRPPTTVEKYARLSAHKLHLLCLLSHAFRRNDYCNDRQTQAAMKKIAPAKLINMLHANPEVSQARASESFTSGLIQLSSVWDARYRVSEYGFVRPPPGREGGRKLGEDVEGPILRDDFRKATVSLEGSADLGAQLFCAMLRSIGLEARLVCSLQVMPLFAGAVDIDGSAGSSRPNTPNTGKTKVYAVDSEDSDSTSPYLAGSTTSKLSAPSPATNSPLPIRRIGRIGQTRPPPSAPIDQGKPPPTFRPLKRVPRPSHPVFWVEVLNHALQKWIPVDPHCTKTVGKPAKLEPALNDPLVGLSYVVAFEEDGSARDVTRRYAKAFNAKTRKLRVESSSPEGAIWYRKALSLFARRRRHDRDMVEDAELARKEASEGMPRNVLDFKDHPYYALERHLRRNEVINPKHESGRINTGTANKPKFEIVYRRKDVHIVRSADKWFRLGREVKLAQTPLKYSSPARRQGRNGKRGRRAVSTPPPDEQDDDEEAAKVVGLYSIYQTETYIPPPVVNGRVPKNAYGNIDVYVPSMIPPGGVHISHGNAKLAARMLAIDFAEAVTGFQFRGRHGTAVTRGVVVAREYGDAVLAVIQGLEDVQEQEVQDERGREAVRLWRQFIIGLRIRQRVMGYRKPGEEDDDEDEEEEEDEFVPEDFQDEIEAEMQRYEQPIQDVEMGDGGGGFFFEPDEEVALPTARGFHANGKSNGIQDIDRGGPVQETESLEGGFIADDEQQGGGFMPDAEDIAGGFMPNDDQHNEGGAVLEQEMEDYGQGGGFLPDDDDSGGGFLPDVDDREAGLLSEKENQEGGSLADAAEKQETPDTRQLDDSSNKVDIKAAPARNEDNLRSAPSKGGPQSSEGLSSQRQMATTAENLEHNLYTDLRHSVTMKDTARIGADPSVSDTVPMPSTAPPVQGKGTLADEDDDSEVYAASLPSHDSAEEDADAEWVL